MTRIDSGSIEVLTGPTFSRKTEELIHRIREVRAAGQKVQVFYAQDRRPSSGEFRASSTPVS